MSQERRELDRRNYTLIGRPFQEVLAANEIVGNYMMSQEGVNGAGIGMIYDDERREKQFTFQILTKVILHPGLQQQLVRGIPSEVPPDIPVEFQMVGEITAAGSGEASIVTQTAVLRRQQMTA